MGKEQWIWENFNYLILLNFSSLNFQEKFSTLKKIFFCFFGFNFLFFSHFIYRTKNKNFTSCCCYYYCFFNLFSVVLYQNNRRIFFFFSPSVFLCWCHEQLPIFTNLYQPNQSTTTTTSTIKTIITAKKNPTNYFPFKYFVSRNKFVCICKSRTCANLTKKQLFTHIQLVEELECVLTVSVKYCYRKATNDCEWVTMKLFLASPKA